MPVRDVGFRFRGRFIPMRGTHRLQRMARRRRRAAQIKKVLKNMATYFGI
jgi:hypothetical protein